MKLTIKRIAKKPTYTIGKLYIDGKYYCDTLEDPVRDLTKEAKIAGNTAIPAGTYRVSVTYSPKFGRDLPLIENVPHFTGIRIHRGNTPADTAGCILVGENKAVGKVLNSTPYELEITDMLADAERSGVNTIEIA